MGDNKVTVNVKPWVGEYPFDLSEQPLTGHEWRWVKKLSGYLPLTVGDGLRGLDSELFLTFAVIAMVRAGKIDRDDVARVFERLSEAPYGGDNAAVVVHMEDDDEEADGDDADPPAEAALPPSSSSTNGGPSGSPTSEIPAESPPATGLPDSERSVTSDPPISVT